MIYRNDNKDDFLVYLDNAATTKVSDAVLSGIEPYLRENYGNPSSIYGFGQRNSRAVNEAREKVAAALKCSPREVYFTAGGSESNNWAVHSFKSFITSEFEHHAVLHPCEEAAKRNGGKCIKLPVYNDGYINLSDLEKALTENDDIELVSVMFANNEIGTIQPIKEIGEICKKHGVLFHTDAVQAVGNVDIDVDDMNISLLSMSAHKLHALKGVGALYARKGVRLQSFIHGGAQERGKRAGTENVAGIVGLGIAIEEAVGSLQSKNAELLKKRQRIYDEVMKIEKVRLNGGLDNRLANNLNFSFEGIEGEALLLQLDMKGIAASSGSACTSGSLDPSHVLLALGLPHEIAHGSLRISMSRYTTDDEVEYFLKELPPIVDKLRAMSPIWNRKE